MPRSLPSDPKHKIVMLEIRIKSNSVKEMHDFIAFVRSNPFVGYLFNNISKVYVMKNGQYKLFVECLDYKSYKTLETLNMSADSVPLSKKRGRKRKVVQTL